MDNYEPNMGSKNENPGTMCPHIGLKDDPATSLGYPSAWNYCHRAKPIAVAGLDHQRTYCLSAAHATCPLFLKPESSPMPAELQSQDVRPVRRNRALWRTVSALVVLAVLVAVVVWQGIARGFFSLPSQPGESTSTPTLTELPASPSEANLTLTPTGGATPTGLGPTLVPTKTPLPTPTTQPVLKLSLETPLGLDQGFLIHRVVEGEGLDWLASKYGTTVALIQAVNYYLPSPLLINWNVIIPMGKIDLQGMPAFQPYMVEAGMTVDEFAQSISVDASTLSYYNGLTATYKLSPGDWLLVPREKINP
ncbi:MAG: LysM domain-containing protein [Chloroflexota bacterium]